MRAAIILGGSGRSDGSEIHESVSCLIHLSRRGVEYRCFAPDQPQTDVINHVTGDAMPESRNLMVEAARISRGQIEPLAMLDSGGFDALVVPGGFGAAKNLCTFAAAGAACTVHPEVERVVLAFHHARKPMAFCCIAPVIAARVLGRTDSAPRVRLTLGHNPEPAAVIESWGASHTPIGVTEALADPRARVVTTPAYMDAAATPHQVFLGIGAMIDQLVAMAREPGNPTTR